MEEEDIIIPTEDNIDEATEPDNDVTPNETIQIIEVEEPETYNIESDSAFPALGEQNEQLNHALMTNRDGADQHTIGAITGLRQELDEIEALKTVESDKVGIANYYKWKDDVNTLPSPADRIGRFVSIHTRDNKISICNETNEVYGVTVDSAAFVGGQDDTPRDDSYCLVATTGTVRVQCEQGAGANSVVPGNYVMSSSRGYAKKTPNNQYGFYVICVDQIGDKTYAVISLSSIMNQLYDLSTDVIDFNKRIKTVEINTAQAINIANAAIKSELRQDIDTALSNSQDALSYSDSVSDQIGDIWDEIGSLSGKVDIVEDNAVVAAQNAVSDAVDTLTQDVIETIQNDIIADIQEDIEDAKDTIDGAIEDVRILSGYMTPLCEFTDGTNVGTVGFVASVENNITQLATLTQYLSKNYITLDTWGLDDGRDHGTIYYTKDTKLYHYYDNDGWKTTDEPTEAGLLEVIASISQKANENEAVISSLASHIGRDYEIIAEWNGYEQIDDDWSEFYPVDNYIIYRDINKIYYHCDFTITEGYPWVSFSPANTLEIKDRDKIYYAEDTKRYYYYDSGHWYSDISPSVAKLVESIALIKQKANENESSIELINSYIGPNGSTITGISEKANANEAKINLLASRTSNEYIKLNEDETWTETGKTQGVIYYGKDSTDNKWKYWYYNTSPSNPRWVGTENPAEAGILVSVANISQRVTENESAIDSIAEWQGTTNSAIAEIRQTAGVDGPKIESLVFNLSKYSVGKYSQAYGLSVADAKELLSNGTVFVPTENTSESYKDTNDIYSRSFIRGSYYVWSPSTGRWTDYNTVLFSPSFVIGDDNHPYLVTSESYSSSFINIPSRVIHIATNGNIYYDQDAEQYYFYNNNTWTYIQNPDLDKSSLYHWDTSGDYGIWEKVATIGTNTLGRAVSQIRQTANEISASVSDVSGNYSGLNLRVGNLESSAKFGTAFANKMATIGAQSSADNGWISLLVSNGVNMKNTWDPNDSDIDLDLIYYSKDDDLFHYHNGTTWVVPEDGIDDPNIASKIHSAGIVASINDDSSALNINADKIDINGIVTQINTGTAIINAQVLETNSLITTINSSTTKINSNNINLSDIISVINNADTTGETSVRIDADKINLDDIEISGNQLTAGSITSDKIRSGAITADKLDANAITANNISIGKGLRYNMFFNDEFEEGINLNGRIYPSIWGDYGVAGSYCAYLNGSHSFLKYMTSPYANFSAIFQRIDLEYGKTYGIAFQIKPLNLKSVSPIRKANLTFYLDGSLYTSDDNILEHQNMSGACVPESTSEDDFSETICKIIFKNVASTQCVDVGIGTIGMFCIDYITIPTWNATGKDTSKHYYVEDTQKFYTYNSSTRQWDCGENPHNVTWSTADFNIAWMALYDASGEEEGFYCSDPNWLNEDYKVSNLIDAQSIGMDTTAKKFLTGKGLTIDSVGNLNVFGKIDSREGIIGCLEYDKDGFNAYGKCCYQSNSEVMVDQNSIRFDIANKYNISQKPTITINHYTYDQTTNQNISSESLTLSSSGISFGSGSLTVDGFGQLCWNGSPLAIQS